MYGKRFTLPLKWITPRFRKLTPNQKVVLYYIYEHCDLAGFMEIDLEGIAFHTQVLIDEIQLILDELSKEEVIIQNGWLFVIDFLELQSNADLNPKNNAHKNIISKMNDNIIYFQECPRTQKILAPYKELLRNTGKSKGQGKGLGQGNNKDLGNDNDLGRVDDNDFSSTTISNPNDGNLEEKTIDNDKKKFSDKKLNRIYTARFKSCETCGAQFNEECKVIPTKCTAGNQIRLIY
jgi:RNA polymerase-binding transcription factor DksA